MDSQAETCGESPGHYNATPLTVGVAKTENSQIMFSSVCKTFSLFLGFYCGLTGVSKERVPDKQECWISE